MPPANSGNVGCAPALGSLKPTAPTVNTAANVTSHLNNGNRCGLIATAYDEPPMLVVGLIIG
jgi:hypothetical protein